MGPELVTGTWTIRYLIDRGTGSFDFVGEKKFTVSFNLTGGASNSGFKESKPNFNNTFKVYPNPVKQELNLDYSTPNDEQIEVNLTNITGQRIKNLKLNAVKGANSFKVSVEDLQAGFYLLKLQTIHGVKTQKVQIQH